jgi:hypothetical protein
VYNTKGTKGKTGCTDRDTVSQSLIQESRIAFLFFLELVLDLLARTVREELGNQREISAKLTQSLKVTKRNSKGRRERSTREREQ